MAKFEQQLQEALLRQKLVSEAELAEALQQSQKENSPFYRYLIDNKKIDEDAVLSLMAELLEIPFLNLNENSVDPAAIGAVPVRFAWHYEFMPIKKEGNILSIAVSGPLGIRMQDELRLSLGYEIAPVLARREKIVALLKHYYGLGADTLTRMSTQDKSAATSELSPSLQAGIEDIEKKAEDASIIKLVNQILLEAYKMRATDIHIEPFRGRLRLRYRIDGVLYDQNVPEELSRYLATILSRIKIMSNLDIVERRIPQDGRIAVKTAEQALDLRVSFIPTPHGESVVIRLLPTKTLFSLEKLGLSNQDLALFESIIKKPNGIIFVTGPTGSGKSTTLYACLRKINRKEKKIITIEDPVEYEMEATTQIQINPEVGLTFARGLRSVLRHDPDIIMIGEVRDKETAEIAIRVALTGHLVFSTLHTNDAATGVSRLIDIGIEPYLVASSVEAFIGQRLIRSLCPRCKQTDAGVSELLRKKINASLRLNPDEPFTAYKAVGCEHCHGTGFYGRTALYEILVVDDAIKRLIMSRANAAEIKRQAVRSGMRTLMQDGWMKVVSGVTTPEEVLNVCQDHDADEGRAEEVDSFSGAAGAFFDAPQPQQKELNGEEKRIYLRIPKRIGIQFRITKKGDGEIVKLEKTRGSVIQEARLLDLFDAASSEKEASELFRDVFTTTANISASGLSFESKYLIPLNSILELKIELRKNEPPVICHAKVIRIEKDLPRCVYIAVYFLDIEGMDRVRIDEFVKNEIKKQSIVKLNVSE